MKKKKYGRFNNGCVIIQFCGTWGRIWRKKNILMIGFYEVRKFKGPKRERWINHRIRNSFSMLFDFVLSERRIYFRFEKKRRKTGQRLWTRTLISLMRLKKLSKRIFAMSIAELSHLTSKKKKFFFLKLEPIN